MLSSEEIIRTVTMGISLRDCVSASALDLCRRIRKKIQRQARELVATCARVSKIRDSHRQ